MELFSIRIQRTFQLVSTAMLNLPLLYQHNPQIFQKANIEPFGEECF